MLNFKLNDGNEIPAIGFGVFMIEPNGPTYYYGPLQPDK